MNTKSHCESKTFSIEQIYAKYQNGELMKPQIQRNICWSYKPSKTEDKTNDYDFIRFICETGNLVNPLIMVERIHNNEKKLFMIDGNNRLNAIINFLRKPLMLFGDDLLSANFSAEVRAELYTIPLKELFEYPSITELFEVRGKENILSKNMETFLRADMVKSYKDTITSLRNLRFMNIEVPITKFENLSERQLVDLYSGLNRTGVRLTEQDILASTTSFITYTGADIDNYDELRNIMNLYYNNMNSTEVLSVDYKTDSLNLFEILMALKIKIKNEYTFIPAYTNNTQKLEFLFHWYKCLFGGFEVKTDMNKFGDRVIHIFNNIRDILHNMYITDIKNKMLNDQKVLFGKQHLSVIFFYMWNDMELANGKLTQQAFNKVRRCIYYNQILDYCAGKKFGHMSDEQIIAFKTKCSLNVMVDKIKKNNISPEVIKEINLDNPTREQFVELVDFAIKGSIEEPKKPRAKRKAVNKFYAMLLSEYFRSMVPIATLNNEKSVEHIIPFGSKFRGGKLGDIDRIGNLTLIDTNVNKKRGNTRITDEFIKKNKLCNLAYPTEQEYNTICNDLSEVTSLANFNNLCARREQLFCECLIEILY